jgi:PAS domain S-box-containing protein
LVRDVTERKQAEEKLKVSEERFRSLFEQGANSMALIDADNGDIIEFNQRAHEDLGYSREEFEKLSLADIDALESPEDVKTHADKIRELGSEIFETRHITREGNMRDMLISARMLNVPGKNRFMSIWTDITERKQAEQEQLTNVHFLESMDRVNRAIQGANDLEQMMSDVLEEVLSIFDCDRVFLLYPCDPEAASWSAPMECTKPEYPGAYAEGLEAPMDPDVARVYRLLLESDGPMKFGPETEHPLPREMSRLFGYKSQILMALYPKTGYSWVFGLHQCSYPRGWTDQEERLLQEIGRRLEDALTSLLMYRNLQESEQRYRMVFENSPVSIWEEDFSGVKNLFDGLTKEKVTDIETYFAQHPEAVRQCADLVKIVDVNRVAVEMHGAANKEELLAGLVNTFTPESFDTFRQELICLWNGCTEIASDAVIKTLTGDRRNVLVHFSVCPGHEEALSKVIVSLTDITERKRLEEELIRAQKLESVGLLAGGIAHDFNNILTAILGNVSVAKMQVASEDDIFKMLSEAEMASMRAQALTKQLLTFAKGGAPVKETASIDDLAFLRKIIGKMLEKLGYESEFAKNGYEAIEMYKRAKEAEKHYAAVILDLTIPGGMGGREAIKNLK